MADKILIVWLMVIGVEMVYSLLNLTFIKQLPDFIIIPFTYGPFLLLYTQSQVLGLKIKQSANVYHFIPFILITILAFFWHGSAQVNTHEFLHPESYTIIYLINYTLFLISMLWYWIWVFKILKSHKIELSKSLSFENEKMKLTWVKLIAWWILGGFILSGITYIIFLIRDIYPFNPIEIYHVGLLLFIFSISYFGIHQPNVMLEMKPIDVSKKSNGDFTDEQMQMLGVKIKKLMDEHKPFLNRELSLHQFVQLLDDNQQMVSFYLNHYLNKNFFTFINEYRVNEAKRLIADAKTKNLTLLAIGYDAGFNSKSSFNAIFKKIAGKTPSEYQKSLQYK